MEEIIKETEDNAVKTEIVEDNPTDEITEEILEDKVEKPEKKRAGILSRIGDILSGNSTDDKDNEEIKVPVDFAKAWDSVAEQNNWTEDDLFDLILEDGKPRYTDEELLEMIPFLSSETEETDESEKSSANEEETQEEDNKGTNKKLQKYEERIAALEKALEAGNKRTQQEEAKNLWDRVSESFDKSGVEVFGKTEQLPRFPDGRIIPSSPQYKARQEVWDITNNLMNAGWSLDKSMSVAFNAFRGKNLETDVKRSIIKDIKSKEQKLSAKRTSHGATEVKHSYGPDVVGDALKKLGYDEN